MNFHGEILPTVFKTCWKRARKHVDSKVSAVEKYHAKRFQLFWLIRKHEFALSDFNVERLTQIKMQ
jgi:hypothetical protein